MMTLSRRERYMLVGGAIVAGLVILVNWVVVPLGRKWADLGTQLTPKLALLEVLQTHSEQRRALLARRARLAGQMGALLGAGSFKDGEEKPADPPTPAGGDDRGSQANLPGLEVVLEEAAKKSGVNVRLVYAKKVAQPAVTLKHFRKVALHVEAESNIESLMKMLHCLEKGSRFIRIDGLKIHQDIKKPGKLGVTMEIVAYAPTDKA